MNISEMNMDQVNDRLAEIRTLLEGTEECDVEALTAEVNELEARASVIRAEAEARRGLAERVASGEGTVIETAVEAQEERNMPNFAEEFRNTNHMSIPMFTEQRSVLVSSGTLATPTAVDTEIGALPETISSIIDDVDVIDASGTGSWVFPYKATDAVAAAVTEGQTIGGTGSTYAKVTVNPAEVGVLDEISNQVKKMTPVAYAAAVRNSAYLALRKKVKSNIVAKILASTIAEKRYSVALDKDFVRNVVLNFDADESVASGTKLYICKADLATLGAVRGTNEKKAVFDIEFKDENNGIIKDGGTALNFSICSDLTSGTFLYGQPKTVKLLLWDNYEVSTDDGGDYFKRNMIGVRGLQTAGADLCAYHGMQIISTSAAPSGN